MPAAKKTPSKKTLTPKLRLYLADDIRRETEGKFTAVGLYTDMVVVANMKAGMPPPSPESPIVLHSLAALVAITGVEGRHLVDVKFRDADNVGEPSALQGSQEADFPRGQTANIAVKFQPFITPSAGMKKLIVQIGDQEWPLEFEIRLGAIQHSSIRAQGEVKTPVIAKASKKRPPARRVKV